MRYRVLVLILVAAITWPVSGLADIKLVLESRAPDAEPVEISVGIKGRWAHIQEGTGDGAVYWIFDGARVDLYSIDSAAKAYTVAQPPAKAPRPADVVEASPASSAPGDSRLPPGRPAEQWVGVERTPPAFKPTKDKDEVAEIRCRVVNELDEGAPTIEHCMASARDLGVVQREIITLARLYSALRWLGWAWPAVGTEDEEFVSLRSKRLADGAELVLTRIERQPLSYELTRIPRDYRDLDPRPRVGIGLESHKRSGGGQAGEPEAAPAPEQVDRGKNE
jgi:hypothetical protein